MCHSRGQCCPPGGVAGPASRIRFLSLCVTDLEEMNLETAVDRLVGEPSPWDIEAFLEFSHSPER